MIFAARFFPRILSYGSGFPLRNELTYRFLAGPFPIPRIVRNPGTTELISRKAEVMADKSAKQPDSIPGKFYVDENCSACQVCVSTAPDNFEMTDDDDHARVFKQPNNDDELEACMEAMDSCPDEAIGDDGE